MADKNGMDWLGLGGIINGIGNSIVGGIMSNKQIKTQVKENQKDRDFNAQQAELARQFSADEAQKTRDYNSQMVDEQNLYNSPSQVMARLKEAGLNPNLVYGSIGDTSLGVGSTAAQGASSSAAHSGSVGAPLPSFSNSALEMAQVKLLEEQAKKVNSERSMTDLEVKWYDALKQRELDMMGIKISLDKSVINLNEKDLEGRAKQFALWEQQTEQLSASIRNLDADTLKKAEERVGLFFDNKFKDATFDAAVDKFCSEAKVSRAYGENIAKIIAADLFVKNSQGHLNQEMAKKIPYEINKLVEECNNISASTENIKADTKNKEKYNEILEQERIHLEYENDILRINCIDLHSQDRFKRGDFGRFAFGLANSAGDFVRALFGGIFSTSSSYSVSHSYIHY